MASRLVLEGMRALRFDRNSRQKGKTPVGMKRRVGGERMHSKFQLLYSDYIRYMEKLKTILFLLLLKSGFFVSAQDSVFYVEQTGKPVYKTWYGINPVGSRFTDAPFAYFVFLPGNKALLRHGSIPPSKQNPDKIEGYISDTLNYVLTGDTFIIVHPSKKDPNFIETNTGVFNGDEMYMTIEQRRLNSVNVRNIYYLFRAYKR
jgi:hypothetical protein